MIGKLALVPNHDRRDFPLCSPRPASAEPGPGAVTNKWWQKWFNQHFHLMEGLKMAQTTSLSFYSHLHQDQGACISTQPGNVISTLSKDYINVCGVWELSLGDVIAWTYIWCLLRDRPLSIIIISLSIITEVSVLCGCMLGLTFLIRYICSGFNPL